MSLGPVQVLVIGTSTEPDGAVTAELDRLAEAGIVRLVDLVLVRRTEAGALDTLDPTPGLHPGVGRIAEEFLAGPSEFTPDIDADAGSPPDSDASDDADEGGAWSLLDSIPVGGTAVIALIEHVWAGPLRAALRDSGAFPLGESWLGPDDLQDLEAIVERYQD